MRKLEAIITLFLISMTVQAQLWVTDPLEALYPDQNETKNFKNKWHVDMAWGEEASAHILFQLPMGSVFTVEAKIDDLAIDKELWYLLQAVPVEQNTGVDSRTEQYKNIINPDVIRRAPFDVFEVLRPLTSENSAVTTNYTALRLNLSSKELPKPGKYLVSIEVKTDQEVFQGKFSVMVHQVKLPEYQESDFFYTNWFNLSRMEEKHELTRWSDSWFQMLEKYAQLMAHGRQNSISIPHELLTYEDGQFELDEDKMLRFINVFRDQGFSYFEAPHLMYRGDNDDWGDPELKVYLTKRRYKTENGEADIAQLMSLIRDFVQKNGLLNNWLQHVSDEPTAVNAASYKEVVGQIKKIYPEIKIMEATNDRDGIAGAIDIWCPLINDFQENEAFFREREQKGEKVLVYTCLIPGGKWLNRTLDMERIRQVYFGWGAAHYNTSGYLHWGLNQYHGDPFAQSVIHHPAPGAAKNNFLPAGDTHIVYPGDEGPLSSVRFEAHRVGCEDYDLLQLLKKKDAKLFKKLVNQQFRSYTDYNLSLKDYRKTKKKLLKSL